MKMRYLLVCLLWLAACTHEPSPPEPTEAVVMVDEVTMETAVTPSPVPTISPTSTLAPSATSTHIPIPTAVPTKMATMTVTSTLEPSRIPPVPTISIWTGIGTPMPFAHAAISPENVTQIQELGRWGKGVVLDAIYSPDGKQIAVATPLGVYFYDAETAQQLRVIQAEREMVAFSISADWQIVAMGYDWPGGIDIWAVDDGSLLQTIETESKSMGLMFTPDSETLLSSTNYEGIMGWGVRDGVKFDRISADYAQFDLAEEGEKVAIYADRQLKLWQLTNGLVEDVPFDISPDGDVGVMAISPDGKLLAVGNSWELQVWVWRLSDQTLLYTMNMTPPEISRIEKSVLNKPVSLSGPGQYYISDLEFSPDSKTLAVTNGFFELSLWDMENGELQKNIKDAGLHVSYAPDGKRLATWAHTLLQWQSEDGKLLNTLNQHIGRVMALSFMPDGKTLAIGSGDTSIYLRRVSDGALFKRLQGNDGVISSMDVSADGTMLISGSANRTIRFWDLVKNTSFSRKVMWGKIVVHLSISADGQYLMSDVSDGGLSLWQVDSGELLENEFGYGGLPEQPVEFSPTEMVFATMEDEGVLGLWPVTDVLGEPQQLFSDPTWYWTNSLAYSPDGELLAAGSRLWQVSNGELLFNLEEHMVEGDYIKVVTFSQDGNLLAAISEQNILLWDAENGELIHKIFTQHGRLKVIAFSPNGRYLAVGSIDGTVRLWGIP